MPLSRIQRGQIQEVLNYDRSMYAKAFDLEKKRVPKFEEEPAGEYLQLDQEVLQQVEQLVAQFKILLDKKQNKAEAVSGGSRQIQKLTNSEELHNMYNQIAAIYAMPSNSPYTKEAILTRSWRPKLRSPR